MPKYTNFTVGFAACLDYIFYQTKNLRMLQVSKIRANGNLSPLDENPNFLMRMTNHLFTGCSIAERGRVTIDDSNSITGVPVRSHFIGGRF